MTDEVLKNRLVKVLKLVAACTKAAGAVLPVFSVAASLITVVQKSVDNESLKNLECEFEIINTAMDDISKQNNQILLDIKETVVAKDVEYIKTMLRSQYRAYMEMVKAKPVHLLCKKNDFIKIYEDCKDDQNINNLYENVVEKRKLFSQPILDVYQENSKGDKQVLKILCTHLAYLFFIGSITMMTYYELKNDDMVSREKEWKVKMEKVQEVMGKWM